MNWACLVAVGLAGSEGPSLLRDQFEARLDLVGLVFLL